MSEVQKMKAPARPLDRALEGLESSIREREQAEKPIQITLNRPPCPAINELYEEKRAVYGILQNWLFRARSSGKKEAAKECERVLTFLDVLCK